MTPVAPERGSRPPADQRPDHSRRRAATSLAVGVLLILAAGLLWWVSRPEPAGQTVSSVGASGALELTVPSAAGPAAPVGPTAPTGPSSPAPEPAPPPTEAGPAAEVSEAAGAPSPAAAPAPDPVAAPVIDMPARVQIPALGVDAPIEPVGVAEDGEVQVPGDVATVGWYRFGPAPGATGSAVLVGHVDDYRQGAGVLARIGDLNPGDTIAVAGPDGTARQFTVVAREQWAKADTPLDRLFDRGGAARLVLITCGGQFDQNSLSYDDNIAVTAVPVA